MPFADGEVLLTFPHIEDQLRFVYYGTEGYEAAGVDNYGNPDREGGPHLVRSFNGAAMPAQGGDLTDAEILGVVCHERYTLGGGEPGGDLAEEYEEWCSEESRDLRRPRGRRRHPNARGALRRHHPDR